MITDARVLQPEFVPNDVKHRSHEVSHLSDTLHPIIDGNRAETTFLYGPSGAGKTCVARYTIDRLRENVVALDHQYINCWEDHTRFKTLHRLLEGINRAYDIHRQSTPRDEMLARLRDHDEPYVVILDEADQLREKSLLYQLYRIPNLTMVLIANRQEDVFSELGSRLNSRLQACARIKFGRYSINQLVTILEDRVRWGVDPGAIDTEQLELIADHAAGDARAAIGIFRHAAKVAQREGHDRITASVIDGVVSEAKSEIRQKTTEKLTEHQQALYDIITNTGEITPGDLYERYCASVSDPKTKRTVRNHLSKLSEYNLIAANGANRGRSYEPVTDDTLS